MKLRSLKSIPLTFISTSLLASISFTSVAFAAGDATNGKAKSVTCVACHGVDGNSAAANFPKIAGQGEGYIYKQLKDFKSGARKDATMLGMVAALSDKDMQNLAAYYASQTTQPNVAKKDANIELGKAIYLGGKKDTNTTACIACHGPKGKGIPSAGFPQVSFQHAAYTAKQLRDFRQVSFNAQTDGNTASRSNDVSAMMQNVAQGLTDTEIEALAQYISGLH
jgi:cytochrome c553